MEVKIAASDEELEAVYRLRYEVYVQEMGRKQCYADHAGRRIEEPLDETGLVLYAEHEGEVVGTVRINFAADGDLGEYADFYRMRDLPFPMHTTSITTKLMVLRRRRSGRTAIDLVSELYRVALHAGIRSNVMDCNAHLLRLFNSLGFKVHIPQKEHEEYGCVSVCVLDLHDGEHLRAVRSPFLPYYEGWLQSQQNQQSA